jgi:hypothetical protein
MFVLADGSGATGCTRIMPRRIETAATRDRRVAEESCQAKALSVE